jgi:hypothetical protein
VGIDYVFLFSTRADGGAGGADRVDTLPPAGVVEVAPTVEPPSREPLSLGDARVITGGLLSLDDEDVPYADLEAWLLPPPELLEWALSQRYPELLKAYCDDLALIEPAFTLRDTGVGRLYAFPAGFATRLEVHERQLAGLRKIGELTGPSWFEDQAREVLGLPLETALTFLSMPALTTNGQDTPSARVVRSTL